MICAGDELQPHGHEFGAARACDHPHHLRQSITLVAGGQYELSLWIYNLGVEEDSLAARVHDGNSLHGIPLELEPIISTELEVWVRVSATFSAPAGAIELWFEGYDDLSAFYLDDIQITLVPAPGAAALAGIAGLMGARRRRR